MRPAVTVSQSLRRPAAKERISAMVPCSACLTEASRWAPPSVRDRWRCRGWLVAAPQVDQVAAQGAFAAAVTTGADLGQQLGSAGDPVLAALLQIALVPVEDAVAGGAVGSEQQIGVGGLGIAAHGLGVQAEPAGDDVDAQSLLVQGVDLSVSGPGALHP
ncbi:hypothetical protein DMB66_26160 [Actinoplanes sp. ATCC 53533]|nr:hypothetical protein DMB66_26160 [Actinoplanes sp. ATCC 53533]